MQKINIRNIRRLYYHARHQYLTTNNVVIGVALLIGASWVWGSIGTMQRNFELQKEIETSTSQEKLSELQVQNLQYEQNYYKSSEYQEQSVRQHLGLALPGEKLLILPPNTQTVINADNQFEAMGTTVPKPPDNFAQWMEFLTGGDHNGLQD